MSHTPAPWAFYPDGELQRADGTICLTGNGNEIRPAAGQKLGDEADDLALIAIAPELLDCLRHTVRFFDQLSTNDINNMRALIARATGETR